jgi:TPR repeat protein
VSAEEDVARLLEVVERTPGRHTPWAQCNLGTMFKRGEGVLQDLVEAVKWYRLAADQGHSSTSVRCTPMVKVCDKTPSKQLRGTGWQQTKGMQVHSATSVGCTTMVQVCGKTPSKQSSGTGWQQTKGLQVHSPTSVRCTTMVQVCGKISPKQPSGTGWQ